MVNDTPTTMAAINVGANLKPPEKLTSLTAEGFKKWKQLFEIYYTAVGVKNMEQESQVALLLHCMGEQCIEIYSTLTFADINDKKKYEAVLNKLEEYFIPAKNEVVSSHIFHTRNQHTNESFDSFVTELRKLSAECNFGDQKDRSIRDRIVAGNNR